MVSQAYSTKKKWDIIGEVVVDMTQTCFRTGHIAKVFNHTNIALIPKVPLEELVKTLYEQYISQNQSAFIPKRSISDNILLANEDIYSVNHNDKVEGTATIKLDMSKAYDKLEWSFLEKVLRKMGLAENWIKLIYQCVSTVSYSVLLNDSPTDNLQRNGTLRGIKVCKNAPATTHLLFVDDSLLFTSATTKNFTAIKNYLQKYCLTSGKEINFDKSGILFSGTISEHRKAFLANILEIQSI
ncbi:uncharacterized protein LOC113328559 [Papaver somniferum]|uniref:uncharacterized protein LOC113328559 n=1 Tax=Papaver somniferum TaxID=3469 RepID=UPI000E6FDE3E|nr:uncharacterized protein LOC113328559 [Papaver somniferum]